MLTFEDAEDAAELFDGVDDVEAADVDEDEVVDEAEL